MSQSDVINIDNIENIIKRFYADMLKDPIIGFIFTDVAKIHLESHLPIIVDFWADIVLEKQLSDKKRYSGNALHKHLQLNEQIPLKPGHFTRWLYLFNQAVNDLHTGANAELMKTRAELVAKSISAAIVEGKKSDMNLTLPR